MPLISYVFIVLLIHLLKTLQNILNRIFPLRKEKNDCYMEKVKKRKLMKNGLIILGLISMKIVSIGNEYPQDQHLKEVGPPGN